MKKLFFILISVISIVACKPEQISENLTTAKATTLSAADNPPKSDMEFNIDKAILENGVWIFTISHGGGCDPNHKFEFYYLPKLTTDCVVDTVHIAFITKDFCKRLDNSTVRFDLNALNLCSKKIILKGGTKLYEITR